MALEDRLYEKQAKAFADLRGLRKPEVKDVFERVAYLGPEDFAVKGYKRTRPCVAFNPGAYLEDRDLLVFPRFIFDYYKYVSSVGLARIDIEDLLSGNLETPVRSRIILWPQTIWEFLGCEDPRAFMCNGTYYILYTGKGYYREGREYIRRDVLGLATFDPLWRLKNRGYFSITDGSETFVPKSNKDSAFLEMKGSECTMLTRPEIKGNRVCWRARANVDEFKIYAEDLEPVLVFEEWELKVGWSTNAVKLSSNEYLVGWHGVVLEDYSYKDGLAVVNGEGELLAVTDYLLAPNGITEEYGDRPLVIFGDGLAVYKEYVLWIGGISDYAIGVFAAELDKVMEHMKWVSKA